MCSSISPLTALFSFHWRVEGRLESTRIGGSASDPDPLIPGYRAADANPICLGENAQCEGYVRLVRAEQCSCLRLAQRKCQFRDARPPKSLYESQRRFREQKAESFVDSAQYWGPLGRSGPFACPLGDIGFARP
jgi:hypothetical protein